MNIGEKLNDMFMMNKVGAILASDLSDELFEWLHLSAHSHDSNGSGPEPGYSFLSSRSNLRFYVEEEGDWERPKEVIEEAKKLLETAPNFFVVVLECEEKDLDG